MYIVTINVIIDIHGLGRGGCVFVVFMLSVGDSMHLRRRTYSFLTLVYNGIQHVSHKIWFLRIGNGKRSAKLGVIGANREIFWSGHLRHVFLSLRPSKRQTDRNSVKTSCNATPASAFSMRSSPSMVINVMKKKAINKEILTIFDLVVAKNGFIRNKKYNCKKNRLENLQKKGDKKVRQNSESCAS